MGSTSPHPDDSLSGADGDIWTETICRAENCASDKEAEPTLLKR